MRFGFGRKNGKDAKVAKALDGPAPPGRQAPVAPVAAPQAAGPVIAYTYALQYAANGKDGKPVWKTCTTVAGELVTGVLPLGPEQPRIDLTTVGPQLLSETLATMGADPKTLFRMAFWKGDVPNEELSDGPPCAEAYDNGSVRLVL